MILIVSNPGREASLLAALCAQRSWACQTCDSLSDFVRRAEQSPPRVVVARHRFTDGYSDDLFVALKSTGRSPGPRVIILAPPNCSAQQEARQVALGADCVLRDPLRLEVMLEYLAKYRSQSPAAPAASRSGFHFAGAQVLPHEGCLVRSGATIPVTRKEIDLLRLLHTSINQVVPYTVLYSELFNRKFSGDTGNSRVLLAKVVTTFQRLGIDLKLYIKVVRKSGYLYSPSLGWRKAASRKVP